MYSIMYVFYIIEECYNKIIETLTSFCYVKTNDELTENLLSKCENEMTNEMLQNRKVIYKIDTNSYVIDHTVSDNQYVPPFTLMNTIYEDL